MRTQRRISPEAEDEIEALHAAGVRKAPEIFRRLKGLTEYQRQPFFAPPKEGEVFRIYLDVTKARKELGWEPTVSLEDGLARTVEHLEARLRDR